MQYYMQDSLNLHYRLVSIFTHTKQQQHKKEFSMHYYIHVHVAESNSARLLIKYIIMIKSMKVLIQF